MFKDINVTNLKASWVLKAVFTHVFKTSCKFLKILWLEVKMQTFEDVFFSITNALSEWRWSISAQAIWRRHGDVLEAAFPNVSKHCEFKPIEVKSRRGRFKYGSLLTSLWYLTWVIRRLFEGVLIAELILISKIHFKRLEDISTCEIWRRCVKTFCWQDF